MEALKLFHWLLHEPNFSVRRCLLSHELTVVATAYSAGSVQGSSYADT
jgi:hypothetical protein